MKNRFISLFLLFLPLLSFTLAAKPTSFCKCTCFTNSTIIALDPNPSSNSNKPADNKPPRTCADCNKSFCLSYNLPICKDSSGKLAEEKDVFTQCFQRDSAKDQAVVLLFISATVGLLVWAAVRPWVEKGREAVRERRQAGYGALGDER